MILLDTNAVIWLDQNHPRTRKLARSASRIFVSPATLLELQLLEETAGFACARACAASSRANAGRFDDPDATGWFEQAAEEPWTRDPFDRLIVAHARVRGFRLASGDAVMLERLAPGERTEL